VADGVKVFLGGDHQVGWTTTFPFEKKTGTHGDINIGNDVWLSHGVTIMSGVTIGDGAVVAATLAAAHGFVGVVLSPSYARQWVPGHGQKVLYTQALVSLGTNLAQSTGPTGVICILQQ
jgi:hypothetical protein